MVQVGLGPGGSCLLTQEEPPPALLPATRHDLAGARLPSRKIMGAPTTRVSLRAAGRTAAASSLSEKCSQHVDLFKNHRHFITGFIYRVPTKVEIFKGRD